MNEYGTYCDAGDLDDYEWRIRAGCVRITDGVHHDDGDGFLSNPGLFVHVNAAHIAVGVTQVRIQAATGYLRVDTDGAVNGVPLVTGDETATVQRLMFGASGGNGHIYVKCSNSSGFVNLATQAGYDLVASSNLNLWLVWLSPLVRGVGQASKADRALADIAALTSRIEALEAT